MYMTGVQAPSRAAHGLGPGFRFVAIGVVSERLPLDRVTAANQYEAKSRLSDMDAFSRFQGRTQNHSTTIWVSSSSTGGSSHPGNTSSVQKRSCSTRQPAAVL